MAAAAHRPSTVRYRILLLMMLYAAFGHFNRLSMPVTGTEKLIPGGIDAADMGLVYSLFLIFYALAMTPGGWFIDRVGTRWAMAAMGFGGAIFAALTGTAGLVGPALLLPVLWFVRPLAGISNAPLHPGAARVVSLWFPASVSSLANGFVTAGAMLGMTAVPIVFGGMIDRFGWPLSFVINGIATTLLAVVWTLYARDRPTDHPAVNRAEVELIAAEPIDLHRSHKARGAGAASDDEDLPIDGTPVEASSVFEAEEKLPVRRKGWIALLLLSASYAAAGYVQYLFFYWLEYYFKDVLHLDKITSRNYTSIANLAMAFGMLLGGLLADRAGLHFGIRRGRPLVPAIGLFLSAVFVALGAMSHEVVMVLVWFSLAMAAVGATEGPFWTTATELGGKRGGLAAAILNTGGNIGGLMAPWITPVFGKLFGWQGSIGLAGVFALVGALLWVAIDPTERL
jgi:MFS family permease